MSVDTKHPDYAAFSGEWKEMRDTYGGARLVKKAGREYLPMPGGFRAQPDKGEAMYAAYQKRAQFPELVAPTIRGMIGVIHGSEWQINMPDALASIWERSTKDGMSLEAFTRRVTGEVLLAGRYGILVDLPREGGEVPYLAGYPAETIINWSVDRDLFVLDEAHLERDGFRWTQAEAWRVLLLEEGVYRQVYYRTRESGEEVEVNARGNVRLDEIPFVLLGARDLSVDIEEPPLIGVARAALAYYRLDADYRHQLYNSGQETLFIINGEAPQYVGAGVVHTLEAAPGVTVDAKYVGPSGSTIQAHREAMQDERDNAANAGAKLFQDARQSQESGEARRLRFGAETATLRSIAQTSAAGLEKALRYAARMIGANEAEVVVTPPARLLEPVMNAQEALALVNAWQNGAFSYQTLYENLQRGQIASAERDHEAESALIDALQFQDEPVTQL